jgi:hypothetical protein
VVVGLKSVPVNHFPVMPFLGHDRASQAYPGVAGSAAGRAEPALEFPDRPCFGPPVAAGVMNAEQVTALQRAHVSELT